MYQLTDEDSTMTASLPLVEKELNAVYWSLIETHVSFRSTESRPLRVTTCFNHDTIWLDTGPTPSLSGLFQTIWDVVAPLLLALSVIAMLTSRSD